LATKVILVVRLVTDGSNSRHVQMQLLEVTVHTINKH